MTSSNRNASNHVACLSLSVAVEHGRMHYGRIRKRQGPNARPKSKHVKYVAASGKWLQTNRDTHRFLQVLTSPKPSCWKATFRLHIIPPKGRDLLLSGLSFWCLSHPKYLCGSILKGIKELVEISGAVHQAHSENCLILLRCPPVACSNHAATAHFPANPCMKSSIPLPTPSGLGFFAQTSGS